MLRIIGFLFLLFIGFSIFSNHDKSASSSSTEPEKPKMSDAQCRQDLQCYADKFQSNATVVCQDPVERRAKNNFEWTDKWYESKFDRRKWDDKAKGTLTYVGDHLKFQNGFGAWTYMQYYCTYDTEAKRVTEVLVMEGRFDK